MSCDVFWKGFSEGFCEGFCEEFCEEFCEGSSGLSRELPIGEGVAKESGRESGEAVFASSGS